MGCFVCPNGKGRMCDGPCGLGCVDCPGSGERVKFMDLKMARKELAANWLESNAVIIDTETTGLDDGAEIVEISAIDCRGRVLMDTLVRPTCSIPDDAAAIHGITDDMVSGAPQWPMLHGAFIQMVTDRHVVVYNASYDSRILAQTAGMFGLSRPLSSSLHIGCAMLAYADFYGQRDPRRRNSFKWQKLTDAARQVGFDMSSVRAHRALGDCLMTLAVIKAMAE